MTQPFGDRRLAGHSVPATRDPVGVLSQNLQERLQKTTLFPSIIPIPMTTEQKHIFKSMCEWRFQIFLFQVQKKFYRKEKKRATKELLSTLKDPSVIVMADWLKVCHGREWSAKCIQNPKWTACDATIAILQHKAKLALCKLPRLLSHSITCTYYGGTEVIILEGY